MTLTKEHIQEVDFSDALGERYLAYAMSTITSRSLPDVRDGLKPVHRRLLYAMLQLKLNPESGFKKCARVVGDVIGKYHPHGDTAVYDAMVRLAQFFSVRYPLVDGQGNFGSIDGDNAAAMRYTEARLTSVAIKLLEDITQNTVDFRLNYDGEYEEPTVLPANFPNLLANGSEGIAVGMATSIPPHNLDELCEALFHILKHPDAEIADLMQYIQGPDFPTGGTIIETKENITKAYIKGKGSFRIRARWHIEELPRGMYQVIITEVPYQVTKSRLIEKIADLYKNKRLALLGDIRDESGEDIRVVLEPKNRTISAEVLMETVFKLTDLESRFNMNLNVITAEGVPKVLNLKEILDAFLAHRLEVLVRKSKYRLGKIDARLEILAGLLIAYLNIDEVIHIIRNEDEPKQIMIAKWGLTDNQTEAILNMRLRALRKLEEIELQNENAALTKEKEELEGLVDSEARQKTAIKKQLKEVQKKFGSNTVIGKRRTDFGEASEVVEIPDEAYITKEPITILCSKMGWIRAFKGHKDDVSDVKYKEGDEGQFHIKAQTTDKLLVFTADGRFYTICCNDIATGKGHGEPLKLMADITEDVIDMFLSEKGKKIIVASKEGRGFIVPHDDIIASTKTGRQILNLKKGDTTLCCADVAGDMVAVVGKNRKLLLFPISELPEMKKGQGVILQRYKYSELSDIKSFTQADGLTWKLGDKTRTETNLTTWLGKRGNAGKMPPVGFPRNNKFS